MLLERYYDDALAQASYLIGCERTREAIVIDPNRDVARYLRAAAAHRMRLRYVTETHIHADFLSGSRELADDARADLLLSAHGGADWSYVFAGADGARMLRDGDTVDIGKVRITVLHTPGHTPEHIAFLITDLAVGDRPIGLVSGDFVFVGDVGRPDLLERAANVAGSMEAAAKDLFASLRRLESLPDFLQIWPGHGAGSACGKALGSVPQTTLGYERLYNPALQHATEDAFVRWVLADQPEPPRYFAVMKQLNRDGPPRRPPAEVPQLDAAGIEASLDRAHWVVDVRGSAEFAQQHLPGTINIPSSRSLPTYAGTVLTYDRPIALIAKSRDQALTAIAQLALIGLDDVAGWAVLDVLQQVKSKGGMLDSTRTIDATALAARLEKDGLRVLDVRGRSEWNEGHLARATHIYLGDLADRASELTPDAPIVVHCQSGTRSSIGASLLRARGFTNVTVFSGGMDAWRRAGLPVER
ncbi:MAG: rhodanese-like domain-containing protein [Gemmatimonadaceae bacterium]